MLQNNKNSVNMGSNKPVVNITDFSNNKKRRINESEGLMDIKDSVINNFSMLYLSTKFSDITIKVEKELIACHKSILGSQSDFFDRLFESQMLESNQKEIELKETDPQLFRLLLKLTYFGQIDFIDMSSKDIIKLFGLIQRYQFIQYEKPFLTKIQFFLNESNVWQMFDTSIEIHSTDCLEICFKYLDKCVDSSIFQNQHFFQISVESLKTLLTRNSLMVSELILFSATIEWLNHNSISEEVWEEIMKYLRLTLIKYEDLMNTVSKSGFISQQNLWHILEDKALIQNWGQNYTKDKLMNRAFVVYDINLCADNFKFEVLEGRVGPKTGQMKSTEDMPQIVVRFGFPFNVNNIEMKLSNKRGDRFSYKIEYSVEGLIWKPLYDYTNFTTSNHQKLVFESIVVQQFRICGTHQFRMDANTRKPFDSIESFFCSYDANQAKFRVQRIDGLLSDRYWISICAQPRIYHDSTPLAADQNVQNIDRYYSRLLSSNKPIIIALDQPIMIDSFQFQLWDRDERAYSYVVEVKDGNDWLKLADKSLEKCRSMQTITFNRRAVSLLRIRGLKIYFVNCEQFRVSRFYFPKDPKIA